VRVGKKMANKKWLAVSYCCVFISVYLLFICYSSFSGYLSQEWEIDTPQTTTINSTTNAISSVSSWSGIFMVVGLITLILVVFFVIMSVRSMGMAV